MMNNACKKILTQAKQHVEFERPVQLAIDITYVAYYGEQDELEGAQGAPENKKYDWCHKFATAAIVGENIHFTVAIFQLVMRNKIP